MKLIILAYDYPPKIITASQRAHAWAKYLNKYGIYPLVITKNWGKGAVKKIEIEKTKDATIYRINCRETLETKYDNRKDLWGSMLRKWYKYLRFPFHAHFLFGPYSAFYKQAKKIITETTGDKMLLVTVQPFGLLKLGYLLHRTTGIPWIADYRDDWTTTELPYSHFVHKVFIQTLYKKQEIKWVSTARIISTVSPHYLHKILQLHNKDKKQGIVIENGFFLEEQPEQMVKKSDENMRFIYVGSLYDSQNINVILQALQKASSQDNEIKKITFFFAGTSMKPQRKTALIHKYTSHSLSIEFLPQMPKKELLTLQKTCHFAVMCPHDKLKGIPSSKLYEFIGQRMPVIYFPNDHDIIQDTLTDCNLGLTAENERELCALFVNILNNKSRDTAFGNDHYIHYSRENSTAQLASAIKEAISTKINSPTVQK